MMCSPWPCGPKRDQQLLASDCGSWILPGWKRRPLADCPTAQRPAAATGPAGLAGMPGCCKAHNPISNAASQTPSTNDRFALGLFMSQIKQVGVLVQGKTADSRYAGRIHESCLLSPALSSIPWRRGSSGASLSGQSQATQARVARGQGTTAHRSRYSSSPTSRLAAIVSA